MLAVNAALVALAGITMDAGTVTALLLLERLTLNPLLDAAELNVTVQASVPEPVIDALLHERPDKVAAAAAPLPVRLTAVVGLADELFEIVSCPVTAPDAVGLNCTVRTTAWPGLRVTGNALPETENPAPVTVPVFKVSAAVPVDDRVIDFVTAVFSATDPKVSEVALTVSAGTAAFNCTANPFETPPALAVTVADCAVLTDDTVAVNAALVALAGITTDAGTLTALLLLERLTLSPLLEAAELNVTVQASVPEPVIDAVLQERPDKVAAAAAPLPVRPTAVVGLEDELLEIVSCPVTDPDVVGAN